MTHGLNFVIPELEQLKRKGVLGLTLHCSAAQARVELVLDVTF